MLHINRTADYVVLWKSHKRAEWAAVGLDHQAAELRQQLTGGDPRNFIPAAAVAVTPPPGTATRIAVAVAKRPAVEIAAALPPPAALAADGETAAELEILEAESRRMWQLHAELGAELSQTAGLLTAAQRQAAEKALQQWAETGGDT